MKVRLAKKLIAEMHSWKSADSKVRHSISQHRESWLVQMRYLKRGIRLAPKAGN